MRSFTKAALIAACFLLLGGGCKTHLPKKPKEKTRDPKADLPGSISGNRWQIHWKTQNPKKPNGPTWPLLDADARDGRLAETDGDDIIILQNVKAALYRDGKRAANIVAPQMTASRKENAVEGSGGVTLTSITDPPDVVVVADRMIWNPKTGKIIAIGNAKVTRLPKKSETPFAQTGNRILFDSALKEFKIQGDEIMDAPSPQDKADE